MITGPKAGVGVGGGGGGGGWGALDHYGRRCQGPDMKRGKTKKTLSRVSLAVHLVARGADHPPGARLVRPPTPTPRHLRAPRARPPPRPPAPPAPRAHCNWAEAGGLGPETDTRTDRETATGPPPSQRCSSRCAFECAVQCSRALMVCFCSARGRPALGGPFITASTSTSTVPHDMSSAQHPHGQTQLGYNTLPARVQHATNTEPSHILHVCAPPPCPSPPPPPGTTVRPTPPRGGGGDTTQQSPASQFTQLTVFFGACDFLLISYCSWAK